MNKRYFVYEDELATHPLDPYGCDSHEEADALAVMAYGPNHHADIRKEYPDQMKVAAA